MNLKRALTIWTAVSLVAVVLGLAGGAWASHRWGCWKYANASISWFNGASGDYGAIFNEEARTDSNSWHNYTDLSLNPVGSAGTSDHINAYAGAYGQNGWLGIAEIRRASGCTILEGRCRLNRSYLDQTRYTRTNKKHVACQEVGHLFGLNHNRGSSTTCMNDTVLTAPQPNSHDRDLINSLY